MAVINEENVGYTAKEIRVYCRLQVLCDEPVHNGSVPVITACTAGSIYEWPYLREIGNIILIIV